MSGAALSVLQDRLAQRDCLLLDGALATGLMQLSVDLALQARQRFMAEQPESATAPLVAASVGPYGAMLADGSEYRGDYGLSVTQLMDFHRPRLAVLAASGADLLACETIPCPQEAEALARLLQQEFPATPAWISFSCRDAQHVWQGERLADCMAMLDAVPQVVALGVNCTDPRLLEALLAQAASVTSRPLLAYPNSGEHWDTERHCWQGSASVEGFVALACCRGAADWRLLPYRPRAYCRLARQLCRQ